MKKIQKEKMQKQDMMRWNFKTYVAKVLIAVLIITMLPVYQTSSSKRLSNEVSVKAANTPQNTSIPAIAGTIWASFTTGMVAGQGGLYSVGDCSGVGITDEGSALKFNLSSIPANAVITNANLSLNVQSFTTSSGTMKVNIFGNTDNFR